MLSDICSNLVECLPDQFEYQVLLDSRYPGRSELADSPFLVLLCLTLLPLFSDETPLPQIRHVTQHHVVLLLGPADLRQLYFIVFGWFQLGFFLADQRVDLVDIQLNEVCFVCTACQPLSLLAFLLECAYFGLDPPEGKLVSF